MTPERADPTGVVLRAAIRRTSLQVVGVSAGLVLAILALAALFVVDQSRPSELLERARPGETKIYVDSREVLIALVVLGAGAVVVVGFASWAISRRALEPVAVALRAQRAFVADASHELRTPLSVLSTRLQILQRRLEHGDEWQQPLAAARRDTDVMGELVTDLLLLAETAAGEDAGGRTDAGRVVLDSVEDLRVLAAERAVEVDADVRTGGARVALSEAGLRRAVTILVDNALQHSPDGARIAVDARTDGAVVTVRVADRGEGIPAGAEARVFERFAHGPATGRRRGFGLGLALVRDLVDRVGGTVEIEETSAAGTVMRLRLPQA